MLIIGLTGGIGCGKSAAADRFAYHSVPIIDADAIARELVTKDSDGLNQIANHFGNDYLASNGELDRAKLRQHIFEHPEAREQLEAILHPLIRNEMQTRAAQLDAPYCVFVIPLLIESPHAAPVDRILVIDCSEDTQRQRVMNRDGNTGEQVDAILASQATRRQRLAAADDVATNESTLDSLHRQIDQLHAGYLQLAGIKKVPTR